MFSSLILDLVDVLNMFLVLIGLNITVDVIVLADVGLLFSCDSQDSFLWENTGFIRYNKWLSSKTKTLEKNEMILGTIIKKTKKI